MGIFSFFKKNSNKINNFEIWLNDILKNDLPNDVVAIISGA